MTGTKRMGTRWKEIGLYGLAMLAARGAFAGCYPLIPGFFTACYMEEVNRTLLLIFSIFGMALFVPVQAMAKYTMVLLVTAVVIRLVEWASKSCRTYVGAGAAGVSVFLLTMAGELMQVRNRTVVWMGILESVLVCGMVLVLSPILHGFLEWRFSGGEGQQGTGHTAPEHGDSEKSRGTDSPGTWRKTPDLRSVFQRPVPDFFPDGKF